MADRVEIDYKKLERDLRKLGDGIAAGVRHIAVDQAETTANKIDSTIHVRTGALAATIRSFEDTSTQYGTGAAVSYGGGLRYAGPIESRYHAVRRGCKGSKTAFYQRLAALADDQAGRM